MGSARFTLRAALFMAAIVAAGLVFIVGGIERATLKRMGLVR